MNNLKISNTKDYFTHNGKGFFYLADTAWSCFTSASLQEWEEYLDYRRMQNFNVLQVNILPQWDRSKGDIDNLPFEMTAAGKFDFHKFNEEYFERVQKMLDMAVEKGFIPALVVLWCDFVKDTWASGLMPSHVMPLDAVQPYVLYIIEKFSRYNPIYLVSGDTNFMSEDTSKYYKLALETIKEACPEAITTMHLAGESDYLPEEFAGSGYLDFYMYQSGHNIQNQHLPYKMAREFCKKPVRLPVVNGEPCYEGHGHGGRYGKFNEFDIRKATWQSLLSGAKAGITYGAHGIWSWHSKKKSFPSEEFSSYPYSWREALRFKGAWDVSFAKYIFEVYGLFDIIPQDLISNKTEEIRCSASEDLRRIAIYAPYNIDIGVEADLSGHELILVNLKDRYFAKPGISVSSGNTVIKMNEFNSDVLVIGLK